jgi:hypothetical protein
MIERIAGKDYTTLANIERMRELCRKLPKDRAYGSAGSAVTSPEPSRMPQCGASATTDDTKKALDAALTIVNGLSNCSSNTSPISVLNGRRAAPVTRRPSR